MSNLDALSDEVCEIAVPVLLLLDRRGDDDDVIRAHPPPGAGGAALLGEEEQGHHFRPAQGRGTLAEWQDQVGVYALLLHIECRGVTSHCYWTLSSVA